MLRRAILSLRLGTQFRFQSTGRPAAIPSAACSCEVAQETVPAEPGSVAHHDYHVFVRLPVPASSSLSSSSYNEPWWPPYVEKEPGVTKVFSAIAAAKKNMKELGPVKVSACIEMGDDGIASHDLYMFPQGVGYRGVDLPKIQSAVDYHLQNPIIDESSSKPPAGLPPPLDLEDTICLFVCCHGSRDSRCGVHGIPLAEQLHKEVRQLQESGEIDAGDIRVFQVSHIGGHKFAGNVIVHGPITPYDGEWYGGMRASDAHEFLKELLVIPDGVAGGYHNPILKKWWRGCIGLTRHQQAELHATPFEAFDILEDGLDEDSGDDDGDFDEVVFQESTHHDAITYMDEEMMAQRIAELEAETEGSGNSVKFDIDQPLSANGDFGVGFTNEDFQSNDGEESEADLDFEQELERTLQLLPEEDRKFLMDAWHRSRNMSEEELIQATKELNNSDGDLEKS